MPKRFKAFLSYSHAADDKLAPQLQQELQMFAKKWYLLRAIRIFRDKTGLGVTPALWPSISSAIAESEYFLYLASEEAAQSHWVRKELSEFQLVNDASRILIVLTGGTLTWDNNLSDFDWDKTTAFPRLSERGPIFSEEPLYVDLKWARNEDQLTLRHPKFRAAVASLSATLRAIPLDEIEGEDVRQHRRTIRVVRYGIAALSIMIALLLGALIFARAQRDEAVRQRNIATSNYLASESRNHAADSPQLAALLSVEALYRYPTPAAKASLFQVLHENAKIQAFLIGQAAPFYFGPDSRTLTVAQKNHTLTWDLTSNDFSKPVIKNLASANAFPLVFNHKGTVLAGRGEDELEIVFWDVLSGKLIGNPIRLAQGIFEVAFTPDDETVVIATATGHGTGRADDQQLTFCNLNGTCTSQNTKGVGVDIVFDERNGRMATLAGWCKLAECTRLQSLPTHFKDSEELFTVEDAETGALTMHPYDPTGYNPIALSFNPSSGDLALGTVAPGPTPKHPQAGHAVYIWDLQANKEIRPPLLLRNSVKSLAFRKDGLLAIGAMDGTITFWLPGKQRSIASLGVAPIDNVRFSPDGKWLISASASTGLVLWNIAQDQPHTTEGISLDQPAVAAISSTGRILVQSGPRGSLIITDRNHEGASYSLGSDEQTSMMAFSPGGELFVSGSYPGVVRVRDFGTNPEKPILLKTGGAFTLAINDAGVVATTSGDGSPDIGQAAIHLWQLQTGTEIGPAITGFKAPIESLAFSRDGRILLGGSWDGTIRLYDLGLQKVIVGPLDPANAGFGHTTVYSVAISDDKEQFASGNASGHIFLWNPRSPSPTAMFGGHRGGVSRLTFSHNGKLIASGDMLGEVRIWETLSGRLIGNTALGSGINALRFSQDDALLIAVAENGEWISWDMNLESWRDRACRLANRNLTCAV